MRIVYLLVILLITCGFTVPQDVEYRMLSWQELRFQRHAVAKINRIAWFNVDLKHSYYVPYDPAQYINWCPISEDEIAQYQQPKIILIVLDEFFIGRIEYGQLVDWNIIAAGATTAPGTYKVLRKDRKHVSNIYHVDMPYALNIYGPVWIHQGFLPDEPAHVSHDCIREDRDYAIKVFEWAEVGVPVIVK